jgi:bla regulator protein blaR1
MINAISHTLVHSLWQGALLSAITGLIMTGTRKSSSALRYHLLVSAMALFAAGVAGTFCFECNEGGLLIPVSADQHVINSVPLLPETITYPASPGSSITETIGSYLNRYSEIIVWVWLLIVCARCVQLATGLREVHRLRHKNTSGIGSYWEERVRQLCGKLGIKRLVGIAQSGLAKTPMVTGHLKPLILVPLGMLTSLSAEEAEAVLLHELAHIRRSDYLVNLLQNIMEIIFFFNPAVLWLSALIKAERENCCDDIAVVRSGKVNYLKALVACEEYKMPLTYAMALNADNGSLKNRAARIFSNKNQSLNNREMSLLAVCLIAAGIFATAFANGGKVDQRAIASDQLLKDTTRHSNAFKSDSERTKSMISDLVKDGIITSPDNLSFKIGTDEFVVNYQKQPEEVYQKYRARYVVGQYSGSGDWIWYYYFDSQKWAAIVAHKAHPAATSDTTSGIFRGKIN